MVNSTFLLMATVTGLTMSAVLAYFHAMKLPLLFLVVVMIADFITGILCASLFKSEKTEKGGLESHIATKGIARKASSLLLVLLGGLTDLLFGINYFCNAIIIGFVLSEVLSVIENCGIMGIPMPSGVKNMVEKLKTEEEAKPDENAK